MDIGFVNALAQGLALLHYYTPSTAEEKALTTVTPTPAADTPRNLTPVVLQSPG